MQTADEKLAEQLREGKLQGDPVAAIRDFFADQVSSCTEKLRKGEEITGTVNCCPSLLQVVNDLQHFSAEIREEIQQAMLDGMMRLREFDESFPQIPDPEMTNAAYVICDSMVTFPEVNALRDIHPENAALLFDAIEQLIDQVCADSPFVKLDPSSLIGPVILELGERGILSEIQLNCLLNADSHIEDERT